MYQHVFWFYSHPAVYIMMLPGFGIISEVLAVKSRKPIFGYRMMAFSLLAIVVLGFTVWAHHMFVSGMQSWIRIPMMITTAIIAVPTGIKIFSWLATLWRGVLHLDTPMLFALGFLTMFTLGGISGVMLAMIPLDIHVSDTYFIVAHIHYVLFGGSLFTIFAGVYYWFPKMTGRMYDERLGKLHFWLTFIFFNLTFAPDAPHRRPGHAAPRRRLRRAVRGLEPVHLDLASFVLGLSTLIFLYNMVASLARRPARGGEPVARADARVAGLLAAADLQLRRGADRRRRPVRVRRPGRGPRRLQGPRRGAAPAPRPAPARHADRARRSRRHDDDPGRRQRDARRREAARRGRASARGEGDVARRRLRPADAARATATSSTTTPSTTPRRCASTWRAAFLREQGIDAVGDVGDPDPYTATMDAVAEHRPDEIIVSTLPARRLGLAAARPDRAHPRGHRPAGRARRRPTSTREGLPFDVTLVVANRTPRSDELLEHLKAKAAERRAQHLFIVVVPQEGGEGLARRAARGAPGRRSSTARAPPGCVAAGMIGDPDPYTATMNALQFFRVDDIVISTLPETRSGWLRADLDRARAQGHRQARSSTSVAERAQRRRRPA